MSAVTKIVATLRERGDNALADDIAAEFGEAASKEDVPAVAEVLNELTNLEDFVTTLDGVSSKDSMVIEGCFRDLRAGIKKIVA
jgi:hypothetical protein